MNWNANTGYDVIFTDIAEKQLLDIFYYILLELENEQAAWSIEKDAKETIKRLSHIAGSLKLCEDPRLRSLRYRTIHFKHHKYFMLYRIESNKVYVDAVYHDLQNFENR